MELEGLKRALGKILDYDMSIKIMITDCHQQINKWLRETHPMIKHYYDVWHIAKGTFHVMIIECMMHV